MDLEAMFYVVFFSLVMPMSWAFGAAWFKKWKREQEGAAALPEAVHEELRLLHDRVAELEERVDFTERLLAADRQLGSPPGGQG
jgi:uncharacterized protein YlxW (UPF0749 family)